MDKKILTAMIAAAVVLLMVGVLAAAVRKNNGKSENSSAESSEELSEIIVIPSEMPGNISVPIPAGFTETSSPYYDKYFVMNDASIIVTGEELTIHGQSVKEYAAGVQKQYEKTADEFALLSSTEMKSGAPCWVLEFTYALVGEDARQDFQCVTAVLVKDDYAYIVTCKSKKETFDRYRSAYLSMIERISVADVPDSRSDSGVSIGTQPGQIGADSSGIVQ